MISTNKRADIANTKTDMRDPDTITDTQSQCLETQRFNSLGHIEHHIFAELVAGRSMESIAVELGMSDLMAESYRAHMMRKMNIYSIIDLLVVAQLVDQRQELAA